MATPKWEYPATGAVTSTLAFPRGGFINDGRSIVANVVKDESFAGEILQASVGADKGEHKFTCQVPTADPANGNDVWVDDLLTFCSETIGWAARSFIFTDTFGDSFTVKLITAGLIPTKRHVNYNEYMFEFREDT